MAKKITFTNPASAFEEFARREIQDDGDPPNPPDDSEEMRCARLAWTAALASVKTRSPVESPRRDPRHDPDFWSNGWDASRAEFLGIIEALEVPS